MNGIVGEPEEMLITRCVRHSAAFAALLLLMVVANPSIARAGAAAGPIDFRSYAIGSVNGADRKYFTVHLVPGTSARQAEHIAAFFRRSGLTINTDSQDDILFASGTYAQAGAAAHVTFVRAAYLGRRFITIAGRETYPSDIAAHIMATTLADGPTARVSSFANPNGIEVGPASGYGPSDIASYYDYGSIESLGHGGGGTNIAVVLCGGIYPPDVQSYENFFGLPTNVPKVVPVDGGSSGTYFNTTGQVELIFATANSATVTAYIVPSACTYGDIADGVAKVLADDSTTKYEALVIGYGDFEDAYHSFGGDGYVTAEDADFAGLAAKGTTTFASNGDAGAFSYLTAGDVGVFFPGSDPNVVSVGVTMAVASSSSPPKRSFEPASYISGGGVSAKFTIPKWQKGIPGIASATMRNVPDVSFNGDCQFEYYVLYAGSRYLACGSVFGATQWAGLLALVDAGRANALKSPLANVPGKLYAERKVSGLFTDVTVGCNGIYCAASGYDNVTGLGVPDASIVYSTLVGLP
ncbi:MAG TPA: S53 family peptidase [Candidatus Eremiobacteraceae bacterium]|nr:S53 family peptidase [Candidatus Eremiobacteraceae bacterium]